MKIPVVALAFLMAGGAALAGVVTPAMEALLAEKSDDTPVRALLILDDRVDVTALDAELRAAAVDRRTRHRIVVETLQDRARTTQARLLDTLRTTPDVISVRSHWLINAVLIEAAARSIPDLAALPEVAEAEIDPGIRNDGPVGAVKRVPATKDYGIGVAPGVRALKADRVWYDFGVDGSGTLVANLDSGVDLSHPALSGSWRGNTAPTAECWADDSGLGYETPGDPYGHGTHVMGTMAGVAEGDTIGVAPGAEWIASNGTWTSSGEALVSCVLSALEFFTDPDGNPATVDDVPDVVQNSWGVNEGFTGFSSCDTHWWDAMDACEAAGVVLVWSAGNTGPYEETMNSPADRADTDLNAFSVGSVGYAPYEVSEFSSRGPSSCGDGTAIKPEVVAPGEDIYSAALESAYAYMSGTSMSGPHVAGVVALMRSVDPDLDVQTIKQVLIDTAVDLGAEGEDNDTGHGLVDAYAAVLAVQPNYGELQGHVCDAVSGEPLAGAVVQASCAGVPVRHATSDEDGNWRLDVAAGDWTLEVSAFAYENLLAAASVPVDGVATADVALALGPTSTITGQVRLSGSQPAVRAVVGTLGRDLVPVEADEDGRFTMSVPKGYDYVFTADLEGYMPDRRELHVDGDTLIALELEHFGRETFESGDLGFWPWVVSGDAEWSVGTRAPGEGLYSARCGDTPDFGESRLSVELDVGAEEFSFLVKTSTETYYDILFFYIDGEQVDYYMGETEWSQVTYAVDPGTHLYEWAYIKDGAVTSGDDRVWIDVIGPPTRPELAVEGPDALNLHLASGTTGTQSLKLVNDGEATLNVELQTYTTVAQDSAATHGGPDEAGWFWRDSDDPLGPGYDWIELASTGTTHDLGDDETVRVDLPFAFPFYGGVYEELFVCSNGWASFDSDAVASLNMPIPSTSAPNTLLAPYWDDLAPDQAGTVYTWADPTGERFVVQWDRVQFYGLPRYVTFELVLTPDGGVLFQYQDLYDRESATVGIENGTGETGLQVVFNEAHLGDEMAIAFIPPQEWLTVSPTAVAVPADGEAWVEVRVDPASLEAGDYSGYVHLTSDALSDGECRLPVALRVDGETDIDGAELPVRPVLGPAYPNPFNPSTRIAFAVPAAGGLVRLDVYDLAGRLVRRLVDGTLPAGEHAVVWSGNDDAGRRVPSGSYVYRLKAGGEVLSRKMTMIK